MANRYEKLEKTIGLTFKDRELLDTVFVHSSFLNEHRGEKTQHNERLEFLGDAVIELAVTEFLYKNFPNEPEGELTSLRAALVKGRHLAEIAAELELGVYLYLSRGEEKSGGRKKTYLLANTLEALIGGIYLDCGFKKAHTFISKFILNRLTEIIEKGLHVDSKSRFQELAQEKLRITPHYVVLQESGPDHEKEFIMGAYCAEKLVAQGSGKSKQSAEQSAALHALNAMEWQ